MTYDDATAWAAGPDLVYSRLAGPVVSRLGDCTGRWVLDAGAGTGAVGRRAAERGAQVVSVDRSAAMLTLAPGRRVTGDVHRLPLRTGSVDAAVAGLVLSHVDSRQVLAELGRVTRAGGPVAVSAFATGQPGHPVKVAADVVLTAAGYTAPAEYAHLKSAGEAAVGSAAALTALAHQVGLEHPVVHTELVDLSDLTLDQLVAWRLGMAPVAAWLRTDPTRREGLAEQVRAAVPHPSPPVPLLVLSGRAAATGRG